MAFLPLSEQVETSSILPKSSWRKGITRTRTILALGFMQNTVGIHT